GFLLGGSALTALGTAFGIDQGAFLLYLTGGILGIILISAFFDWALIAISSFAGASIIVQSLNLDRTFSGLVLIILLIAGILIQFSEKRKENKKDD
ncbi:MAG: hypothetical protein HGA28_06550, partial [Anaerolineaceae bacterium]|nr:hypothetical protein [Anaerolineaceae bacterium]